MRTFSLCVVLVIAALGQAQDTARYDIPLDEKSYPQSEPKQCLESVIKAMGDKKINYLLAHLADPAMVDKRVKSVYGGVFAEMVRDAGTKLDPTTRKLFSNFVKDGKWQVGETEATVTLPESDQRGILFLKSGNRWFMRNEKPAQEK